MTQGNQDISQLFNLIENDEIFEPRRLGNIRPIYIATYSSKNENEVIESIYSRVKLLNSKKSRQIIILDAFQLLEEVLAKSGYLEKCTDLELKAGSAQLKQAIQSTLNSDGQDLALLTNNIVSSVQNYQLLIIHGFGTLFPIIRAHKLIHTLRQSGITIPVVILYPGTYKNNNFLLFDNVNDGNEYQAMPITKLYKKGDI
jgi:hypothetical protein